MASHRNLDLKYFMNSLKELNGVALHLNTEGYVATMTGCCTRSLSTMRNASVRQHNTEIGVGCIEGKDQGSEPNQVFTEKRLRLAFGGTTRA